MHRDFLPQDLQLEIGGLQLAHPLLEEGAG
jgi:hypothetical protein